MNIRKMLERIDILRKAIFIQKRASSLTKMQRVIQRVATRRLIKAFDEAQLDTAAAVSDMLLVAALLGIKADSAFNSKKVKQQLTRLGGSTGINWKPNIVAALRPYTQLTSDDKDRIIGRLYTDSAQSAAYTAGAMVFKRGVSVKQQLEKNSGAIVSAFRMKVTNLANDLVNKDNEYKIQQDSGSTEEQDLSGNSIVDLNPLIKSLDSYNNDQTDADEFINNIMISNHSPLSARVRAEALPHIKEDLEGHFITRTRPWLGLWAQEVYTSKKGFFLNPGLYSNFKGQREFLEWMGQGKNKRSPYKNIKKFESISNSISRELKVKMENDDLVILGAQTLMGKAEKSNKSAYLISFSFQNLQTPVLTARTSGTKDIRIVNFTKRVPAIVKFKTVQNVHFFNVKLEGTALAGRVEELPLLLERLFNGRKSLRDALRPVMHTEQEFRPHLQASKKQANNRKLPRHINVPF